MLCFLARGIGSTSMLVAESVLHHAYRSIDLFMKDLARRHYEKSAALLGLERLVVSKPALAKDLFNQAVLTPFWYHAKALGVETISSEGRRRIEEVENRFLQEPMFAVALLEAILVVERVLPELRKIAEGYKTTSEELRARDQFFRKCHGAAQGYAFIGVAGYVRERDYRLVLGMVAAIDGSDIETQLRRILATMPALTGAIVDFQGDATKPLITADGIQHVVGWLCGDIEF